LTKPSSLLNPYPTIVLFACEHSKSSLKSFRTPFPLWPKTISPTYPSDPNFKTESHHTIDSIYSFRDRHLQFHNPKVLLRFHPSLQQSILFINSPYTKHS
jgi:hypothetical protein